MTQFGCWSSAAVAHWATLSALFKSAYSGSAKRMPCSLAIKKINRVPQTFSQFTFTCALATWENQRCGGLPMRENRSEELIPGAPGNNGNQLAIGDVSAPCVCSRNAS